MHDESVLKTRIVEKGFFFKRCVLQVLVCDVTARHNGYASFKIFGVSYWRDAKKSDFKNVDAVRATNEMKEEKCRWTIWR